GVKFSQFDGAEMLAQRHGLDRARLDEFGYQSHRKAAAATEEGRFARETLPLEGHDEEGRPVRMDRDEGIRPDASLEPMASLKPLSEIGLLTAGTSSQISDGAAAVLIVNERGLAATGLAPRARIHAMTVVGDDPVVMLGAPIPATEKLLARTGMKIEDIDLYEVNEAFASVPLAWLQAVGADPAKLNVNGGAIALGHPLGCTG